MNKLPKARINGIVTQDVNETVLIYDLKTNKVYSLNETSNFVWRHCDGKTSVSGILQKLKGKFKTEVDEDFVCLALDNLQKENLLETEFELPNSFKQTSRRQIIKKIGLTSMIALPLIKGFIAPRAVNAQSGDAGGCTPNAQNCSPTNNSDLFVFTFAGNPTPFCQFNDPNCQSICDAAINQCCSCNTVLLPDTINAAFVCRCV